MDEPDPWDESAASWDDDEFVRAYADGAFASLVDLLGERGRSLDGATVCDFGCGTGLLTERMADTAGSIDAVDTSPAMLDRLGSKVRDSGWTNVHVSRELPASAGGHDLGVCSSVLAFVDDYPGTVRRLVGLLAPGGMLVQWDWERTGSEADDFGFERDRMREVLTAAGLIDVRVSTAFEIAVDGDVMRPLVASGATPARTA